MYAWIYLFIYFFNFIFKLYIIVLVLPNIKMNPPQVYMCSPSWTLLPPPSPFHPSGSSQCTSRKHPVSCIEPGMHGFKIEQVWGEIRNSRTVYMPCYHLPKLEIHKAISCILKSIPIIKIETNRSWFVTDCFWGKWGRI